MPSLTVNSRRASDLNRSATTKFNYEVKTTMTQNIFLLILLVFIAPIDSLAGCIEGNCENGQGVMLFDDGSKYEGHFKDEMLDGIGSLIYANGNHSVGEFKKSLISGKGAESTTSPHGDLKC